MDPSLIYMNILGSSPVSVKKIILNDSLHVSDATSHENV